MKHLLLLPWLLLYGMGVFGQDTTYAREVVRTLASPEFKGRGYVGEGNRMAAEYIRDQYVSLGLKAFGKDYFQSLKLDINTFPSAMELKLNGTRLVPGKDYLVDPASGPLKGEFGVYIMQKDDILDPVKVRYAIQASAGKFLVIDGRNFSTSDKQTQSKASEFLNFLKYTTGLPIAGVLELTSAKLDWNTAPFEAPRASFTVQSAIQTDTLKSVTVAVDASLAKCKTQNVIGYLEGTARPDTFLVVLAHYDHLGKMGADTYFPGANDNASGVAMLLTLARYYAAHPPKYSMAFIALTGEEAGIEGSKFYVANPLFDLKKIKFLVNFDLAGTGDDGIKVVNGTVYKDAFNRLTALNEQGKYLKSVQIRGAACNSDHCPFYEKGVPCFYIYTLGGIAAYHDIYDRSETLPMTEFGDYAKLMLGFFTGF